MEKRFLKYTLLLIIFFVGLSMGISHQENNRTDQLQKNLKDFENDITQPNNDFDPVNPNDDKVVTTEDQVKGNIFTTIGKDGEYLVKRGIHLILDRSDDFFRMIFT